MKSFNPPIRISSSRAAKSMVLLSKHHNPHHRCLLLFVTFSLVITLTTTLWCIAAKEQQQIGGAAKGGRRGITNNKSATTSTSSGTTTTTIATFGGDDGGREEARTTPPKKNFFIKKETTTTTMHHHERKLSSSQIMMLETFNGMHEEGGDTDTTTTGDDIVTRTTSDGSATGTGGSSNNNNNRIGGTTYNGMQENNRIKNNNDNPNPNPNNNNNDHHHNMYNKMITQNQNNNGNGGGITIEGKTTQDTRIVGGTQALPGDYPYFVDLRQIGCGGSLIAPRVVLTAAHCDESASVLIGSSVIVGAYEDNIGNNAGTDGWDAVTVQVSDQSIHPQYNTVTVQNDFQLLLLQVPINIPDPKLTIIIQKNDDDEDDDDDQDGDEIIAALTTTSSTTTQQQFPPEGTELSVIGLGLLEPIDDPDDTNIDFDEILPDFVMHVEVPVVNSETCFELYERVGITDFDSQTMFCAGDIIKGGIDSCQGDSGGPIVDVSSDSSGKQHVQVGVVSWGLSCADSRFPGVYAKIESAKEWIHDVVCDQWQVTADFCFDEQTTVMPTSAPTIQSCGSNEIFVDWRFHIDAFGGETSFEITKSNGNVVESGFPRYDEDTSYRFQHCLPADECYKLQLTDTFGDGFCCGGNPSYKLIVDDNVLVDVMVGSPEIDFGSSIEFEFGNLCATTPDDDTSQPTAAIVPPPPPPPPITAAPQQSQPTPVPTIPSMLRPTAMTPNVPTPTTLPTTGSVPTITPPSSTTDEESSSVSNPTSTTTLEPSETNASMVEDNEVEGGDVDDSNASSATTESSASRLGLLIGISAGVLVIIILVLVLAYLLFKKRRPSSSSSVTKGQNKTQNDVARDKTADAQWSDAGSYNSFNSPNGDNNGHEYTGLSLSL